MNIRRIQAMLSAILLFGFLACEKIERLPFYLEGFNPDPTAPPPSLAPALPDSQQTGLPLAWATPEYLLDRNWFT